MFKRPQKYEDTSNFLKHFNDVRSFWFLFMTASTQEVSYRVVWTLIVYIRVLLPAVTWISLEEECTLWKNLTNVRLPVGKLRPIEGNGDSGQRVLLLSVHLCAVCWLPQRYVGSVNEENMVIRKRLEVFQVRHSGAPRRPSHLVNSTNAKHMTTTISYSWNNDI